MLIAAITSCTNTSNPGVLLAAGLLAKKAVELGLTVKPHIKTSLAPGSRVVTEYLDQGGPAALPREARLQRRRLRLHHVHRQRRPAARSRSTRRSRRTTWSALRCCPATAISRPRIHPNIRANFLASPPLVVALRARRHDAEGLQDAADRHVEGRQGRLHRPHLAERGRGEGADEARDGRADLPPALFRPRQLEARCGRRFPRPPARSTPGRSRPTSPSRRSSTASP